jgi:hypothetical protein
MRSPEQEEAMKRTLLALMMAVTALGLPAGRAAAQPAKPMDAMISAAKTAAEHEALAAQYDKDAADAKAKAAEHRRMGEAYKGQPAVASGKGTGVSAMPQHCANLVKSYDEQAQMYTAMAAAERELAKAAK